MKLKKDYDRLIELIDAGHEVLCWTGDKPKRQGTKARMVHESYEVKAVLCDSKELLIAVCEEMNVEFVDEWASEWTAITEKMPDKKHVETRQKILVKGIIRGKMAIEYVTLELDFGDEEIFFNSSLGFKPTHWKNVNFHD